MGVTVVGYASTETYYSNVHSRTGRNGQALIEKEKEFYRSFLANLVKGESEQ